MNISVILPTLNEEAYLHGTLEWLRRTSRPPAPEVIVVDGGSTDGTLEAARRRADRVLQTPRSGRGYQMHLGAQVATGELFLFLHADTLLPESWQESLTRAWSSPSRPAAPLRSAPGTDVPPLRGASVLADASLSPSGTSPRTAVPRDVSGAPPPAATAFRLGFDREDRYYRWVSRLAHCRSLWTGVPHGDQAIAVHRETYFATGGFPDVPLMEEYLLFGKLNQLGPVRILPEAVRTSARRYERAGPLAGNLRNHFLILGFYLGVPPRQLARLSR